MKLSLLDSLKNNLKNILLYQIGISLYKEVKSFKRQNILRVKIDQLNIYNETN